MDVRRQVALQNARAEMEEIRQAERDSYIPQDGDGRGIVEKIAHNYPDIAGSPELWHKTAEKVELLAKEKFERDGTDPSIIKGKWEIYKEAADIINHEEALKDY